MTHNDFRGSGGVRAVVLAAALLLSLLLLRPAVVGADGELQVQIHSVDDSGEHPFAIVTVLDASGRPVIGWEPISSGSRQRATQHGSLMSPPS